MATRIPFTNFAATIVALLLLVLQLDVVQADGLSPKQRDAFEVHIRPVLVKHCIKCHGSAKQEGGLQLTTLDGLLKGGDSGPAVVPGKPEESLLLEALRYDSFEMPPSGQLDDKVIAGVEVWIKSGAGWPRGLVLKPAPKITSKDRDWWCYQPIRKPAVPTPDDSGWSRNEIDRFILQRLKAEGIRPAVEASDRTLARRVSFAVTGLPPGKQAADVLTSGSGWYERLVDQLLGSSAYGENQARFWLDLVRYADSDGYNADHSRPEARHYRDYVIRSFNDDKPYDRFVLEQLAGDEIDPGNRDALIATMYLRHWIYEWNQRDVEGQWQQILSDVTETTSDVFLAQGLKCARCHDHKFDPLLQRDYYALKAFFAPLQPRNDQPIADVRTRAQHLKQQRQWEAATADIRAQLHDIERPVLLEHASREGVDKFTKEIQAMIAAPKQERTPYQHQIATLASNQFTLHPDKLAEWLSEEDEAKRQQLLKQLNGFKHLKPAPLPTIKFTVSDVGPDAPTVTIPDIPDAKPVKPGFPTILDDKPAEIKPPDPALQSTGRRTTLARWIASPENPLTARVIVNRVWQQHFGRGLVETSSDFGQLGTPPSHPELLDWLARRFMEDGWSLKKLHRLILNSATYRQSSTRKLDQQLAKLDPQNVLLWRMNPRRLSGEELYDSLLWASSELAAGKRAIYKPVKRNRLDPILAAFDFPDRVESNCRRHRTTTSPQSLLMMNDPWMHDRAKNIAVRSNSASFTEMLNTAFERLYFRKPENHELQQATKFFDGYRAVTKVKSPQKSPTLPDGRPAILLAPQQPATIKVPSFKGLNRGPDDGDFTLEATVMLKSLYPNASVRTIAASWSGKQSDRGWSLGVTSTQSRYKPRNLILQFVGSRKNKQGKPEYEVIPSNLRVELNKPYQIAVSINLEDSSNDGITFYLKDLSKPDAKPLVAKAPHLARWNVQADSSVEIGGRSGHHRWDGLIHNVRLHNRALQREELFTGKALDSLLFDLRFADRDLLGHDASGNGRHATVSSTDKPMSSPELSARTALLHALLMSNETIYVD